MTANEMQLKGHTDCQIKTDTFDLTFIKKSNGEYINKPQVVSNSLFCGRQFIATLKTDNGNIKEFNQRTWYTDKKSKDCKDLKDWETNATFFSSPFKIKCSSVSFD